jgi:hypothetical protein
MCLTAKYWYSLGEFVLQMSDLKFKGSVDVESYQREAMGWGLKRKQENKGKVEGLHHAEYESVLPGNQQPVFATARLSWDSDSRDQTATCSQ